VSDTGLVIRRSEKTMSETYSRPGYKYFRMLLLTLGSGNSSPTIWI